MGLEGVQELVQTINLTWLPGKIALIIGFFGLAWLLNRVVPRLVRQTAFSAMQRNRTDVPSERRLQTIGHLTYDLTRFVIYTIATVFSLALFVDTRGLFTFLGLFSAAFGLGARPLVSDYMSGIVFLFEDQYSIGDKVEINGIEGTVEDIRLRTTSVRAPSGELHFIPNGEVRMVRNFARGAFSQASVRIKIKSSQLAEAVRVLDAEAAAIAEQLPDLVEPIQVLAADGVMGATVELTLVAKASYGHGAQMRHQLLEIVHQKLAAYGVTITE